MGLKHPDVIAEVAAGCDGACTIAGTQGGMKLADKITLQSFIPGCGTWNPVESNGRIE